MIGCGKHSGSVHGPSCKKYAETHPDTILAGCCDLNGERARDYQQKFGFRKHYTDMEEMLNAEKPDAVMVAVPERLICPTAVRVINLGYHVLLEKPPGLCREETLRIIEAAEKNRVINQVAFNRRYLPLLMKLREEIAACRSDGIQNIFYEFYRYRRTEPTFETTAIHGIDAVKSIAGSDYREVRFTYQELPQIGDKVANILLECSFANGVIARINFVPCAGVVIDRACVNLKDHTFFMNTPIWDGFDAPGELVHIHNGTPVSRVSGKDLVSGDAMFETNGFYDEDQAFFDCVRAGKQSPDDAASALQSVEIAEAIGQRKTFWKA